MIPAIIASNPARFSLTENSPYFPLNSLSGNLTDIKFTKRKIVSEPQDGQKI